MKDLPAGAGGPSSRQYSTRRLLGLLYPIGLLILADQLADLTALLVAQPVTDPSSHQWRFVAFGLVTSRMTAFLIADALIVGAAVALGHRRVLRFLGAIHLALAVVLIAGLGMFSLDALELRSRVPAGERRRLLSAAARAFGVTALGILLFLWVGIVALRDTRVHKGRRGGKLIVPMPEKDKQP